MPPATGCMKAGVTINRPPRDGSMAFVRSPDKHSIELLQKGEPLPPQEPWASMPNSGQWWIEGIGGRRSSARCLPLREGLYMSPRLRALRLAVQDAALSRRKHGFDSRRARQ